jgi:hypothetical protein
MERDERDEERGGQSENDEVKVNDRRLFTSDGRLREDLEEEETPAQEPQEEVPTPPAETPPGPESPGFERRSLDEPEGVDFTMLINAMAQPALIFLGGVAHPGSGRPEINLEQARVQIDMLDVLRIKCRGNLTAEEEGLLDRVLYELRMRYVARSSQPPSE